MEETLDVEEVPRMRFFAVALGFLVISAVGLFAYSHLQDELTQKQKDLSRREKELVELRAELWRVRAEGVLMASIGVPGYPPPPTFGFDNIQMGLPPNTAPASFNPDQLTAVLRISSTRQQDQSDAIRTLGNAVLIDPHWALTAGHVAEVVASRESEWGTQLHALAMTSSGRVREVSIKGTKTFPANETLDIGLIRVDIPEELKPEVTTSQDPLDRLEEVYCIGSQQYETSPTLLLGRVFTKFGKRAIRRADIGARSPIIEVSGVGTNLADFPGLSGSPVFRARDGRLCGVVTKNLYKEYVPLGTKFVNCPGADEESCEAWEGWTWVAPTSIAGKWIEKGKADWEVEHAK